MTETNKRNWIETIIFVVLFAAFWTVGTALAANASPDNPCHTIEIVGFDNRILFGERTYEEGAPTYAEAGEFLWFTWGGGDGWNFEDTLTFDVSDGVVEAKACADGEVTLTRAPIETSTTGANANPDGPSETHPRVSAPVVEPLTAICEQYPDTLTKVCALPRLGLVVS